MTATQIGVALALTVAALYAATQILLLVRQRDTESAALNASLDAANGRRGTAHGPVPHRRTVKPGSAEEHNLQTQTQPFKPRLFTSSVAARSTRGEAA